MEKYRTINIKLVFKDGCVTNCIFWNSEITLKFQWRFRKGFNAQYCLINLLEKWRESLDQSFAFGILLADVWKAFEYLSQELFIVKLIGYVVEVIIIYVTYFSYLKISS